MRHDSIPPPQLKLHFPLFVRFFGRRRAPSSGARRTRRASAAGSTRHSACNDCIQWIACRPSEFIFPIILHAGVAGWPEPTMLRKSSIMLFYYAPIMLPIQMTGRNGYIPAKRECLVPCHIFITTSPLFIFTVFV